MILHDTHLQIGSLVFEGIDQIELTGPFEVLSRIPNAIYRIDGAWICGTGIIRSIAWSQSPTVVAATPRIKNSF